MGEINLPHLSFLLVSSLPRRMTYLMDKFGKEDECTQVSGSSPLIWSQLISECTGFLQLHRVKLEVHSRSSLYQYLCGYFIKIHLYLMLLSFIKIYNSTEFLPGSWMIPDWRMGHGNRRPKASIGEKSILLKGPTVPTAHFRGMLSWDPKSLSTANWIMNITLIRDKEPVRSCLLPRPNIVYLNKFNCLSLKYPSPSHWWYSKYVLVPGNWKVPISWKLTKITVLQNHEGHDCRG